MKGCIVGFMDEASPQTTSNTVRLWSIGRPEIWKNTDRLKANAFGFYSLNGSSVIEFMEHSRKEDVCQFLQSVRAANPSGHLIIVLDNFNSHKAKATLALAARLDIEMVFLPSYSPDLNPIEFIWKSIKRIISTRFMENLAMMKESIATAYSKLSVSLGFASYWIRDYLGGSISNIS